MVSRLLVLAVEEEGLKAINFLFSILALFMHRWRDMLEPIWVKFLTVGFILPI